MSTNTEYSTRPAGTSATAASAFFRAAASFPADCQASSASAGRAMMPLTRVAAGQRAGHRAEPPPLRPEPVERGDGEQQEQRLGIDHAVEEREGKHAGEDHRALGRRARQVRAAEAVEHHHREHVRHPRDDDAGKIQILTASAERQAHVPHEQRIHGEEGQVAPPALHELVAVARDPEVPARVVARKGVPEQVRAVEHGELLLLGEGKDHVDDEGHEGREHPHPQGERNDAERRAEGGAAHEVPPCRAQRCGGAQQRRRRPAVVVRHGRRADCNSGRPGTGRG